jgi:hypothetical protein
LVQSKLQHCLGLLHGAPLPSHTFGPQVPCTLHGPEQQGSLGLQMAPSCRHMGLPQTPLLQMLLQQGPVQGTPSGRHLPQTLFSQIIEQHGALAEQPFPSGMHCGAPQMPLGPQVPVQHCDEALHDEPSWKHWGFWAQAPPSQRPVQHWEATVHAEPTAPHVPPHTPAAHTPSQHSAAVAQGWPLSTQVPPSPPPPPPWGAPRLLRPQLPRRKSPAKRVARTAKSQA